MVIRFRVGSNRPIEHLNLHVSTISPLPKSYIESFKDSNWQNSMNDKYNALIKNNSWTLVPRPVDANIIHCMWFFRHKHLAGDTLSRYKAHIVANGSIPLPGIHVDETFSLVVKPATIRIVFSWPLLDIGLFISLMSRMPFYMIIASLHQEFSMTDLGPLNYFLGIYVVRDSSAMFLSQSKYATKILERAHMVGCNPTRTPVDKESKLGVDGLSISNLMLS
ncbi:ribonuclease H-like domain-containing protein [Tanacetum coccineum]